MINNKDVLVHYDIMPSIDICFEKCLLLIRALDDD